MSFDIVDPNAVLLVGENSIVALKLDKALPPDTLCSFWRVVDSVVGPGHALFLRSSAFEASEVSVHADNEKLARLLQKLERLMRPEFADADLPVRPASFERSQRGRDLYIETVT